MSETTPPPAQESAGWDDAPRAAEPERQSIVKHLREHGRATRALVWVSRCRWCRLGQWWWSVRNAQIDGSGSPGEKP